LVSGFRLFQVESKAEAVEWVKRPPDPDDCEAGMEIRQVFEGEDFGEALTPELKGQEERLRAEMGKRHP
jgi:hypothetical protein